MFEERIYTCPHCGTIFSEKQIANLKNDYYCPQCKARIKNIKGAKSEARFSLCAVPAFILAGILLITLLYAVPSYLKPNPLAGGFALIFFILPVIVALFIAISMFINGKFEFLSKIGLTLGCIIIVGYLLYAAFILGTGWAYTILVIIDFLTFWILFTLLIERLYYGSIGE